jgi:hypothetical protein
MRAFPLLALLLLGACALEPSARPQAEPRFEPEQWFLGRTFGTGEFRPLLGKPSEFRMVVEGRREGQALIMEETFTTAEGGAWRRTWTITHSTEPANGTSTAYDLQLTTSPRDPAGSATAEGDLVRMDYLANAPMVKRPFPARFRQSLRLRPDGTVLNIADVHKYGVRVGRSTVVFRKAEPAGSQTTGETG